MTRCVATPCFAKHDRRVRASFEPRRAPQVVSSLWSLAGATLRLISVLRTLISVFRTVIGGIRTQTSVICARELLVEPCRCDILALDEHGG